MTVEWELLGSNPREEVPGVVPEGAHVSVRQANDPNVGDEVVQMDISAIELENRDA